MIVLYFATRVYRNSVRGKQFEEPWQNKKINDLDWLASWLASYLAGWLAIPGEARIRPWKGFWCVSEEILLLERNLRSPDKI